MRFKVIWPPVLLMGVLGGLVGAVWGLWWGLLLITPLSFAVGWAVSQQRGRREP